MHVHLEPREAGYRQAMAWPQSSLPGHLRWPYPYLFPSQGDHVQGPIHEPACHNLWAVLIGNCVIDPVVGCHVLEEGRGGKGNGGGV